MITLYLIGYIIIGLLISIIVYLFIRLNKISNYNNKEFKPQVMPVSQIVDLRSIEEAISSIPTKVLQSIQSSTNTKKGALGELIGYIELQAEYDRIIPLGNIVDFMCIKFPKQLQDGIIDLGQVDFIDIKTGKSSRLSKDQRELQKLIKDRRVNFVKLKVDTYSSADKPS